MAFRYACVTKIGVEGEGSLFGRSDIVNERESNGETWTGGVGGIVDLGAWSRGALVGLDIGIGIPGTETTAALSEIVSSRVLEIDVDKICCDTKLCEATSSAWGAGDFGTARMLATLSSCDVEDFGGAAVALATVSICGKGDLGGDGVALTTVSTCGTGDFGGVGLALISTSVDLEGVRVALLICWLELDTCSSHKTGSRLLGVELTIGTDLVFMVDVAVAGTGPLPSSLMATGTAFGSGVLIFVSLTPEDCSGPFRT